MKASCILLISTLVWNCYGKDVFNVDSALKLDFDVFRGDHPNNLNQDTKFIKRRDNGGSYSFELSNTRTFYTVHLDIGSNEDKVQVLLDTGSSDLWVNSHDVKCTIEETSGQVDDLNISSTLDIGSFESDTESPGVGGEPEPAIGIGAPSTSCGQFGSFNTDRSDSFKRNESAPEFQIQYADSSQARGIWGTDKVQFDDVELHNVSFAVANVSSCAIGVLGIGLVGDETTYSGPSLRLGQQYTYRNFPVKLKEEGIINKIAYSLYLGNVLAKQGTLLFGAYIVPSTREL